MAIMQLGTQLSSLPPAEFTSMVTAYALLVRCCMGPTSSLVEEYLGYDNAKGYRGTHCSSCVATTFGLNVLPLLDGLAS